MRIHVILVHLAAALALVPRPSRAQSDVFLSHSALLRSTGVEITPAQLKRGDIVLPVLRSDSRAPMTFLSSKGNVPLRRLGNAKKGRLDVFTCGSDELATPWKGIRRINGTGHFVASGSGIRSVKIEWHEAVPSDAALPASCSTARDLSNSDTRIATTENPFELMYSTSLLTDHAIRSNALYKRLGEKAYQFADDAASRCAFETTNFSGLQRAGLLAGSRCDVLLEQKLDCEQLGSEGATFMGPLGVLTIGKGDAHERWLVYEAAGYEGNAYIGLRVSETRPLPSSDVDVYVYSGC
jgi:hypothetical protein